MNVDIQRPLAAAHAAAKAKGGKIVSLAEIAAYLQADPAKVAIAVQHLATARAAVETSPGQWALVSTMPAPAVKRGKIIQMPEKRKATPLLEFVEGMAMANDRQQDNYKHQDPGDDGRAPW